MVIVHATEYANAYMVVHWQEYSTQNYFDEKGLFMSSVVSAPILVTNFYMLLYGLYNASSLLISVKANQLKKGKGKAGKTKEGGEKAEVTGKKANANLKAEKVD